MYTVSVQLSDGNFLQLAAFDQLQEAVRFATELNANWPHKYIVLDSCGNKVDLATQPGGS